MKKKKKPNYKLRRTIAKIIIAIIIIIPIILINLDKIKRIPVYYNNKDYKKVVDAFFDSNYTIEEVNDIMVELRNNKRLNEVEPDMVISLNNKGYSHKTINYIIKNMSKQEITKLLNKKYDKEFEKYILVDNFVLSKYSRYLNYQKENPKLSLDDIVTRVELNLDKEAYEDSVEEKDPNSITALVNKHRYMSKDYVPDDLVEMEDAYSNNSYGVNELRKEAYEQFKKMVDDAKKEDITFYAESAYRGYKYQDLIYDNYVYEYGVEKTDTFAARAGFSEHQLGTTIDLANIWTIEEGDPEYKWIDKNGYKYGYIFRYKKEFEDITGYKAEGWHIRYVGVEAATIIHKKNLTFDEYWVKYVKNNSK